MIFLTGLVLVILLVLGLAWDTSNWLLERQALSDLADGAALAAANELDTQLVYASNGTVLRLDTAAARATAADYLGSASGVRGARVTGLVVTNAGGLPEVRVQLAAPSTVVFLRYAGVSPPVLRAEATARLLRTG